MATGFKMTAYYLPDGIVDTFYPTLEAAMEEAFVLNHKEETAAVVHVPAGLFNLPCAVEIMPNPCTGTQQA